MCINGFATPPFHSYGYSHTQINSICSSYLADRKQGQSWCAAPRDITPSACEGSVLAVRRGGRQQSCLGFPWQLEDIQLLSILSILLLNSIQILWNLTVSLSCSFSFTNPCSLPPSSPPSLSLPLPHRCVLFQWGGWKHVVFLWGSSVCAFARFERVLLLFFPDVRVLVEQ